MTTETKKARIKRRKHRLAEKRKWKGKSFFLKKKIFQ